MLENNKPRRTRERNNLSQGKKKKGKGNVSVRYSAIDLTLDGTRNVILKAKDRSAFELQNDTEQPFWLDFDRKATAARSIEVGPGEPFSPDVPPNNNIHFLGSYEGQVVKGFEGVRNE